MEDTTIKTKIKRLENKLYDNLLKKRAGSKEFGRIFISHNDDLVHLSENPDCNGYHGLLCIEDTVIDPDGIIINSSIALTKGSFYFDSHYTKTKLCQKCFKYIKPSDVMRLEAENKRQEGKKVQRLAQQESNALVSYAEELEQSADGLDKGSVQINLEETKDSSL